MPLVFIRHHVKRSVLPRRVDLSESVLDSELFRRGTRDVLDLVVVLVKAPVDDPLQREILRLVVKLATGLRLANQQNSSVKQHFTTVFITVIILITVVIASSNGLSLEHVLSELHQKTFISRMTLATAILLCVPPVVFIS